MAEIDKKPTLDDWDIMAGNISQSIGGGDNIPGIDPDDLIELIDDWIDLNIKKIMEE